MRRRNRIAWILWGIALALLLPIFGSIISAVFIPELRFSHLPIHSLVEAAGGLMAVAIAAILIAEGPRKEDAAHYVWMASALIGMGILDLYHAAVLPGNVFVWLHSTATFVGGVLFALVWLPPHISRSAIARWMPWGVLAGTVVFGSVSCLNVFIPDMASAEGEFTLLARGLNIGGGIGFLIAGAFFVRRFFVGSEDTDWLFAVHTILFGAAGILFELSALWDAAWWWWHVLRLVAYLAALAFAVRAYLDAERALFSLNRELSGMTQHLDRTVEERTAELKSSEERYELAVRGSTDGLWDWNIQTDQVFYGARFKELLGFSDSEFPNIFASFESRLHEEDVQPVMVAVQAHLQDRIPYDVEYRLRHKSGEYLWFRARGQAIWDDDGQPTRMAGSITNITAEKQAKAQLQHERFLFHTLLEHLPDPIYFKDAAGRFIRVATALVKRLGAKNPEEVLGKTDADFFPAEYATAARQDEERLMRTGQAMIDKEESPQWPGATECWVSTTKVPLRDEKGDIIGTFGISHDVTAHKLAEERFRRVIEATANAMVAVDGDGTIQFINASTERLFGYSRDELIGQSVEMLIPDSSRAAHVRDREEFAEKPVARQMGTGRDLEGLRKDGRRIPIEISLSPIRFDEKTMVLSSIYDLTKRKEIEEALISAKEAAESANKAKSDFLANMSHEIRTPMNAVIGMTELVLDGELTSSQRSYMQIVHESAESLLTIINQILDFSKIEAGRLELESTDFDLVENVGDTMRSLSHRAHAKDLELAWIVDTDVPRHLCGDPVRLRQILVNLVGNAIKFTEKGEIVLSVTCESRDDARVTLKFVVRDTGIGIPEDKLDHVFGAFEQADASTTRQFGGTGLGLAITARLIEAMNGRIWVESSPGEGSRFLFLAQFKTGGEPKPIEYPGEFSGTAVLVVDDNATNLLILEKTLKNWGVNVLTAASAHQALQILHERQSRQQPLPLLISDVNMPEMDGFMLVEELRSRPEFKDIKIILLTSGGRSGDLERCQQLGIKTHLMKPAKQSELLEALSRASGRVIETAAGAADGEPSPTLPPLSILLAEDGKSNQILAMGLLTKWGHRVVIAEDGQQAIDCWKNQPFDVILMDVQMPVLDGLSATRRIREIESQTGNHIPIVAMTARAMKGDREECIEAGMDDYVAKPVRRDELYRALGRALPEPAPVKPRSESRTMPEGSLIDWRKAAECVSGDEEILREVAATAADELPQLTRTLDAASAKQDLVTAQRAAHTIKSTLRILGAYEVVDLAADTELAAKNQDAAMLKVNAAQLVDLVGEVLKEIKGFRDRSDRSS